MSPSLPSHPASRPVPAPRALEDLLRALGPQLRRGDAPRESRAARLATGLPEIDRLIGGGFAPGRIGEIAGAATSGRTSLALSLLACTTARGEVVAWVDPAEAFDPASAEAAGTVLARVLWARPPGAREAARCCACLLDASGFALVVLDLAGVEAALSTATWQRLARAAAGTDTALVVLSSGRATGSHCDLALALRATRAHFTGTPALLEALEVEAVVTRQRRGPSSRAAMVRLRAASSAA